MTARNHKCHRGTHFSPKQWDEVEVFLRLQWSPQQICNVLRMTGRLKISVPTIYRWIRRDKKKGGTLFEELRIMTKTRRKRYRSEDYRGRLKGKRSISERPLGATDRSELGHWEGDTVMGSNKFECVVTLVEGKTGLARVAKVLHRTASQVNAAIGRIIAAEPYLFKTITFDNDTEFHSYKHLEKRFATSLPHTTLGSEDQMKTSMDCYASTFPRAFPWTTSETRNSREFVEGSTPGQEKD